MRVFEVGDKVVVRKNFWKDTPAKYSHHVGINPNMKSFSGQKAKITKYWRHYNLDERVYTIDIDGRIYTWVSDWLEHMKVEVREGDDL